MKILQGLFGGALGLLGGLVVYLVMMDVPDMAAPYVAEWQAEQGGKPVVRVAINPAKADS